MKGKLARLLRRMADYLDPPRRIISFDGDYGVLVAKRGGIFTVEKEFRKVEPISADDLVTKDVSVKVEPE